MFSLPFDYTDFDMVEDHWIRYEGQFFDDNKEGFGSLFLTNSELYSGNFKNDLVNGQGTFYQKDGNAIQGMWSDNRLQRKL